MRLLLLKNLSIFCPTLHLWVTPQRFATNESEMKHIVSQQLDRGEAKEPLI